MNRRVLGIAVSAALLATSLMAPSGPARAAAKGADLGGTIKAGYGVADNTWHVGAGGGQYTAKEYEDSDTERALGGGDVDPHNHSLSQKNSYGVQSRLTFRAIVVEDAEGDQTAFVKSDNYLAMDALQRRVGQILFLEGSEVSYDEIFHMASHNHYSPMYSTPSWGVWLFQDVFDIRAFEYQAQQMAAAILMAEDNLVPAKMGATTVEHHLFKGMVARRGIADDGTPVGYPLDFGDFGLSVVRFDELDDPNTPADESGPIATLVNWGMHPEGLEGDNLLTAEFLAPLERFAERATGSPIVFGQGDVGSSESGPGRPYEFPAGIPRNWNDSGYLQVERGGYLLAQDVIKAYNMIGEGDAIVPFDGDFDVAAGNYWAPGPYSHPYPSVSNCRSEPSAKGDTGVPVTGLPDCDRGNGATGEVTNKKGIDHPFGTELGQLWDLLQAEGFPVPSHYNATGFTGVEENLRLHLQAFKLGEVILLSCACEAQVDLILNLETRVDEEQGNVWLGYDWTKRLDCAQANKPDGTLDPDGDWTCLRQADDPAAPRATFATPLTFSDTAYERMQAQIYNDAGNNSAGAGSWDAPQNAVAAQAAEPDDKTKFDQIWGNFTHEELSPDLGYKLPIGVGHAGDYNGYTVSYREYMAYDHYRKALTSYGPHTADYMNKNLMELAGELNGAEDVLDPVEVADEARAQADEARQVAWTTKLGAASFAAYTAWRNSLPNDLGPAEVTAQPEDIDRFHAATFSWRGGSNAVDNPTVKVQRMVDGEWVDFADQSGEIQTTLDFPNGVNGFAKTYSGGQDWIWSANFEAFNAFPAGIGSTPEGEYRFVVVEGHIRQDGADVRYGVNTPYPVESEPFTVSAWDGLQVQDLWVEPDGSVSFAVDSTYPKSYDDETDIPYINKNSMQDETDDGELRPGDNVPFCKHCSFRPWATRGEVEEVVVTVTRADGSTVQVSAQRGPDGRWYAATDLYQGDRAQVEAGAARDNYGERNSEASGTVEGNRERPVDGPEHTALTLSVDGKGSKRVLTATLTELDSGAPIAGREIEFYANEVFIGGARTSGSGVATLNAPPGYRGDSFTFRATFEGDLAYLPSWAMATT